ncbi:hypothetical protein GO495_19845 [Chitinophaga oryziterrae]|uniref:ParB/Sulfiredoxin domain-containing protein n=1 Tax=Chitinophaga oryziterrae TaxID=1031224 RepID=A0A6N8JEW3_9BACT|nr:hypothetical protein [Chitinophaga oryziterrae]MVT42858.1 hypothetical protein [Chitinophaga oryziterrae]
MDDNTIHDDLIVKYTCKSIEELKSIIPKWAWGRNKSKLLDISQSVKEGRYAVKLIAPSSFMKLADFYEVDCSSLFTGEKLNDSRIARILDRWENKQFVDPPSINLSDNGKQIVFQDGRHRAKISFLLGYKEIPLAIDIDNLQEIIVLFKLVGTII